MPTPLANAVDIQIASGSLADAVSAALNAANTVHGIRDDVTTVPVQSHSDADPVGRYAGHSLSGEPVHISISELAEDPGMTFLHEFGHYIDHHGLGSPGSYASGSPALDAWRDAVINSTAVQQLRHMFHNPSTWTVVLPSGVNVVLTEDRAHIRYLLKDTELFARSYCQLIAEETAEPTLLAELGVLLMNHYPEHWASDDFVPISAAMRQVLEDASWSRS